MHELSIATAVLDTARRELRAYPQGRPRRLALRIGEWSGVDPEALRFCLEALVRDTEFAGADFDIQCCPRRNRCPHCGDDFEIVAYQTKCPACGASDTEVSGGTELELAFVELEEA